MEKGEARCEKGEQEEGKQKIRGRDDKGETRRARETRIDDGRLRERGRKAKTPRDGHKGKMKRVKTSKLIPKSK